MQYDYGNQMIGAGFIYLGIGSAGLALWATPSEFCDRDVCSAHSTSELFAW